jgi:ubiquinone biosynthesis protein
LLKRGNDSQKILRTIEREAWASGRLLRLAPKLLYTVLRQTASGKQRLELRHSGFDDIGSRLERGLNRLILGIVLAASIIAGALVLDASEKILVFTVMGNQSVSLTSLLGLLGYTIATFLGLWLIISIFRSGRM